LESLDEIFLKCGELIDKIFFFNTHISFCFATDLEPCVLGF